MTKHSNIFSFDDVRRDNYLSRRRNEAEDEEQTGRQNRSSRASDRRRDQAKRSESSQDENLFRTLSKDLTRQHNKQKAGRQFSRTYGKTQTSAEDSGPRPALYNTAMGPKHKRASRMQNEESHSKSAMPKGQSSSSKSKGIPRFIPALVVAVCLVVAVAFLYTPAQHYYQQVREKDRLALELSLLNDRKAALEEEIDLLSTDEGIRDRAREDFGYVMPGEIAVNVNGLKGDDELSVNTNILSGDVKPPDTWYSGFLDPFFGVSYE